MSIAVASGLTEKRLKPGLEKLFRDHSQMVYRTAYAMLGNASDAEDVLQTVFLSLRGALPRWKAATPLDISIGLPPMARSI
jgi:DNA-directed RNA polymerase specialized sigma24 family protein